MKYHNCKVALIYGMPSNGKTSFSNYLLNNIPGSKIIHVDTFFPMLDVYDDLKCDVYNISNDESFVYNKHHICHALFKEVYRTLNELNHLPLLIIEGYSLVKVIDQIVSFFNELQIQNIYRFEMYDMSILLDGKRLTFDEGLKMVKPVLNIEESSYQSFDFITPVKRDSDSLKKFETSNLLSHVLSDKTILDIGCNAGYFMFKILNNVPSVKLLIGVDTNYKWLNVCYNINSCLYNTDKIQLLNQSIFDVNLKNIDVAFCFSTFHYFTDKQTEFLKHIHVMLNVNGFFILEIEVSPNETGVEKRKRGPNQGELEYPSHDEILKRIDGLFYVAMIEKSVFQPGQFYDRYFYHLRKI